MRFEIIWWCFSKDVFQRVFLQVFAMSFLLRYLYKSIKCEFIFFFVHCEFGLPLLFIHSLIFILVHVIQLGKEPYFLVSFAFGSRSRSLLCYQHKPGTDGLLFSHLLLYTMYLRKYVRHFSRSNCWISKKNVCELNFKCVT